MCFRLNFEMCANMITMIPIRLYSKSKYIFKRSKKKTDTLTGRIGKHISKKGRKFVLMSHSKKYAHANREEHTLKQQSLFKCCGAYVYTIHIRSTACMLKMYKASIEKQRHRIQRTQLTQNNNYTQQR